MEDVSTKILGATSAPSALRSVARAADSVDPNISPNVVKGVLGVTSLTSLLFGVRSAWKHSRQPDVADLARAQVYSGVGVAAKALGIATLITVSGFSLLVVGVSWALNANSPRQFGESMKKTFGDSLRLPQSKNSQSFEDLINNIENKTSSSSEQQQQKQ